LQTTATVCTALYGTSSLHIMWQCDIQNTELINECSTHERYLWNLILKRSTLNRSNETAPYIQFIFQFLRQHENAYHCAHLVNKYAMKYCITLPHATPDNAPSSNW
jgi:hypothetical protein